MFHGETNRLVAKISITITVVALCTAATTSEASCNDGPTKGDAVSCLETKLINLQSALEKAEERIKTLENSGGVPSHAVLPFDIATGCPNGWQDFTDGAGRTIIGTGASPNLTTRRYRDVGGKEKHQLTIPEMPKHSHSGNVGTGGESFEHHQSNPRMPSTQWQDRTGFTGENQPHENMPPYIALNLCKKL